MSTEIAESATILVVDDEEDVGLLFRQQFRREIRSGRVAFAFAHSAAEALAYLRGGGVASRVFSDINMPGMSGLDLLRVIRAEFGRLPVHILSAYGDEGHVREAAEGGADGFFTKPLDFEALKRAAVAPEDA